MKLWIDESDGKSFFVSVQTVNENEYLSFDYTTKGHRVMIQKLAGTGVEAPKDRKPDGEWDTLVIDHGRLIEKQRNVWFDFGNQDLVDGERWQQIKEWSLDISVAESMLHLTHEISEHQSHLESVQGNINALEMLIFKEADRCGVGLPK